MQPSPTPGRYHRQTLLPQIGNEGQAHLARARVLLVGCGALGTTIADQLVRAGVGTLRIADRDLVELTNLQRQTLFAQSDVYASIPKSIAARNRLAAINSQVTIDAQVVDVNESNLLDLMRFEQAAFADLVLDGTDNAETRYLVNDACVKHAVRWVYGACVGTEGRVMAIVPGAGPCLRCVFRDPPSPGELATCDTAGVLGPAAAAVASLQAACAIRLLCGGAMESEPMAVIDAWTLQLRSIATADARDPNCPCCGLRQFEFLEGARRSASVVLCGRNAVQLRPSGRGAVDLSALRARLSAVGSVEQTAYYVHCSLPSEAGISLTVFPDGRLIVYGTNDLMQARSIGARYVGV